jgi:hypothetical protein
MLLIAASLEFRDLSQKNHFAVYFWFAQFAYFLNALFEVQGYPEIRAPTMIKSSFLASCFGLLCLLGLNQAKAAAIQGLFRTGVDNQGNSLTPGSSDPHYLILDGAVPNTSAIVMDSHPWLGNTSTSMWIWETRSGQPTNVYRTFRTTFDLTGLDPNTASINGIWIVDNQGIDILINGSSTGNTQGGFSTSAFSIQSGFQAGINILDFKTYDYGAMSGFRITEISGTASPASQVPEPTSCMIGLLLGTGFILKRYRANKGD